LLTKVGCDFAHFPKTNPFCLSYFPPYKNDLTRTKRGAKERRREGQEKTRRKEKRKTKEPGRAEKKKEKKIRKLWKDWLPQLSVPKQKLVR
jgi:hypothetical protein